MLKEDYFIPHHYCIDHILQLVATPAFKCDTKKKDSGEIEALQTIHALVSVINHSTHILDTLYSKVDTIGRNSMCVELAATGRNSMCVELASWKK
jgi:hypothetical protein